MVAQVKLPTAVASEAAPSPGMAQHDSPRLSAGVSPATKAGAAPATDDSAPAAAGAADADGEWVGGAADDEADDECTLEEEEVPLSSKCPHDMPCTRPANLNQAMRSLFDKSQLPRAQALAKAAGEGTDQHAAEVSALADEADMPLDQLLAQYGYVIGEDGRKRSADDAHGVEGDGSPSHGKPRCWEGFQVLSCKQTSVSISPCVQDIRS